VSSGRKNQVDSDASTSLFQLKMSSETRNNEFPMPVPANPKENRHRKQEKLNFRCLPRLIYA
jgi:hypothetical protein